MELVILLLRRLKLLAYANAAFILVLSIAGYQDQPRWLEVVCFAYILAGYPLFKSLLDVAEAIGCQGKGRGDE